MGPEATFHSVSDDELLRRLGELVSHSRHLEADVVSHIGEVDERRLYAREACPSMFAYCTERLHLSEAEAYLRITVARAAREHPLLLRMLGDGRLHLSGIAKLVPLLTRENREALLGRATHLSKRQIVELVAELSPRADVASLMRRLPQQRPASTLAAPGSTSQNTVLALELRPDGAPAPLLQEAESRDVAGRAELHVTCLPALESAPELVPTPAHSRLAVVEPLSPARYKVQFTASAQLKDKLERLSALMRGEVPDADLAAIIERAVTEKLERLEARRYARTSAPRKALSGTETAPTSRHIPAAVRRAVARRDGIRCSYVDERGQRCSARDRLEFHHRHPFGIGGDHSPANVSLLCSSHNRYMAERDYGRAVVSRRSPRGNSARPAFLLPENTTAPLA
jgi:hypothetical protein